MSLDSEHNPADAMLSRTAATESKSTAFRALQSFRIADAAATDNPILRAATPLLSFAVLVRRLSQVDDVGALLDQVREDIIEFETTLKSLDFENTTIMAARYILCTTIDESVLSQDWGTESIWSTRPLLSTFHNETWGGKKFFAILDRVYDEPTRFKDFLEFIYYCQSIGFEGQFHLRYDGAKALSDLLARSHERIAEQKPGLSGFIFQDDKPIATKPLELPRRMPLWAPIALGVATLLAIFIFLNSALTEKINVLRDELHTIVEGKK